ncbi:MAG: hypothetical protein AB1810_12870 [Pseudomonadota bacterium]
MCAAKLSYPQQYAGRKFSIGSSREELDRWLSRQEGRDVLHAAHELLRGLVELNRLSAYTPVRYHIMKRIIRHADPLLLELIANYNPDRALLSAGDKRDEAGLIKQLIQELAFGFKIVITELANREDLEQLKEQTSHIIYNAMYYLSQFLLFHYQLYEPVAGSVWGELNLLYRYAKHLGSDQTPVSDKGYEADTVTDAYKNILLLSAINPYRLLPGTVYEAYDILKTWSRHAQLVQRAPGWRSEGEMVIDLNADRPPEFIQPGEMFTDISMIRVLDIAPIKQAVIAECAQWQDDISGVAPSHLKLDLCQRLLDGWQAVIQRASVRRSAYIDLEAHVGLDACHSLIVEFQRAHRNGAAGAAVRFASETENPLWNTFDLTAQFEREMNPSSRRTLNLHQLDVGMGGYGLRYDGAEGAELAVGDLVCLRKTNAASAWRIGEVRWKKPGEGHSFTAGIQLLAEDAEPFYAARMHDEAGNTLGVRGLLIPGNGFENPAATLLLKSDVFQVNDLIHVHTPECSLMLALTAVLGQRKHFTQFAYAIVE